MNKEIFEMSFFMRAFLLLLFLASFGNSRAQGSSVLIELKNIEILQGNLLISLTKDSTQFASFINPKGVSIQKVAVKASTERLTFKNLESGWYAIAVFQDLNGNDSLDTRKFKIPAEPFGFSNNALARFRPPWFKDARFYLTDNRQITQIIDLVYLKPKKKKDK